MSSAIELVAIGLVQLGTRAGDGGLTHPLATVGVRWWLTQQREQGRLVLGYRGRCRVQVDRARAPGSEPCVETRTGGTGTHGRKTLCHRLGTSQVGDLGHLLGRARDGVGPACEQFERLRWSPPKPGLAERGEVVHRHHIRQHELEVD